MIPKCAIISEVLLEFLNVLIMDILINTSEMEKEKKKKTQFPTTCLTGLNIDALQLKKKLKALKH